MAIKISPETERPDSPNLPTTHTKPRRSGGWFRRIQYRIKLALAGNDEEIMLENNTVLSWKVYHDYHMLGIIDPGEARLFRLQKRGQFSARPGQEGDEVEYLVLTLNSQVRRVEIYRRHMGREIEVYDMRAA